MPELTGEIHHTDSGAHLDCRGCNAKVDTLFQITGERWLCAVCAYAVTGQSSFRKLIHGGHRAVRIDLPSGQYRAMDKPICNGELDWDFSDLLRLEPPDDPPRFT